MPPHRVSEPIVDIEQERDLHGIEDGFPGNARTHHRSHVLWTEAAMVEGHLLEQTERGAKRLADRRCRVIVQNLLDERIAVERGGRDRGVSVRSKVALIHA